MHFTATPLVGAFVIEIEPHMDERGFFARTWCAREFAAHGIGAAMVQTSISRNERRGTIRGMHLQLPPSIEAKLVRCTRGAIYDVIVDLRPQSPSYLEHFAIRLAADAYNAMYIPAWVAHGSQALDDETEVLYQMTDFYTPELGAGFRWNDPAFSINWPIRSDVILLRRDAQFADFNKSEHERRFRPM